MKLDIVDSFEHYEDDKIRLNLPIYLRKNETFFVSKSFFWRRWHHGLQCCFSFEIAAVSSVLLFHWSVWISKSKITEIFSLFVCFPTCFELVNNWLRDRIMSIQSWQIMNVTLPLFKKRCVTLLRLNYGLPNMCLKPSFI